MPKYFQPTDKVSTTLEAKHPEIGGIFDSCHTYDKEHGRLETRCLKASTALNAYLKDWPGLAQVIEYRTIRKNMHTGKETHKVQYGITRLDPKKHLPNACLLYGVDIGQ